MAVRHGYGKIAGTDALVFAYDTGDTRNSYKGEPTTNLTTDTPSQNGWAGTYSVVDSASKTFTITTRQDNAATTSAWRTWYWSVSSYIGSYVTISADVEFVSETDCTFSNISIGQGNTGSFPYHIAGSNSADKVTISDKPVQKIHMTWSGVINSTGIVGFTQWIGNVTANGANAILRLTNVQIEAKDHETPFVNGTRSATEGLKDLTGNSSIDLSNVSFDSNAQMTFDGTDDEINTGITTQLGDFSCEVVFKDDNSGNWGRLVDKQYTTGFFISSYFASSGAGYVGAGIIEPSSPYGQSLSYDRTKYNYFIVTRSGSTHTIYLNGASNSLTKTGSSALLSSNQMAIGSWNDSYTGQNYTGEIPIVKLYNRALTADEVRNNYRHYKKRFNI